MQGLFHLLVHVLVYCLAGIILYSLRYRLSLIPFYLYLGILQVFTSMMSSFYIIDLGFGISIAGGSIAYAAVLWSVMLLYTMERNLSEIKLVILGILAVQIVFILAYPYFGFLLDFDGAVNPLEIPSSFFGISFGIFWVGNALALIEMVMMVYLVERFREHFTSIHSVVIVVFVFILTLLADAILFPLFAFPVTQSISIIQGLASILSKLLLGLFYSTVLVTAYVLLESEFIEDQKGVQVSFSDMIKLPKTDVIRAWHEAEENQAMVRLLLDIISHDIRNNNLLTLSIIEVIEMQHPELDDSLKEKLAKIQRVEQQTIELLSNTLALSLVQERHLQKKTVGLDKEFSDAIERLQSAYPEKEIVISGIMLLEDVKIICNELLDVALYNVLSNIIKYNKPENPRVAIEIDLEIGVDCVHLVISDQGIGIADEKKLTVFDSLKKRPRRKNFGLYLASAIMNSSGCEIRVENREDSPNDHRAGTSFHLTFPLHIQDL